MNTFLKRNPRDAEGLRALLALLLLTGCGARSTALPDDDVASDADADTDADTGAGSDTGPGTDDDPVDPEPDPGRECVPRAENTPPTPPTILYPRSDDCTDTSPVLRVDRAFDADGDVLRYHFQIDADPGLRSPELQETPADGLADTRPFVRWALPVPLQESRTYFWRVWVDDCIDESEKVASTFDVCPGYGDAG